jgi:hypothetical protein
VTANEDIASVAGQLTSLTRTVEEMGKQLKEVRVHAASQQERSDTQQERIDLAARELGIAGEQPRIGGSRLTRNRQRGSPL